MEKFFSCGETRHPHSTFDPSATDERGRVRNTERQRGRKTERKKRERKVEWNFPISPTEIEGKTD